MSLSLIKEERERFNLESRVALNTKFGSKSPSRADVQPAAALQSKEFPSKSGQLVQTLVRQVHGRLQGNWDDSI